MASLTVKRAPAMTRCGRACVRLAQIGQEDVLFCADPAGRSLARWSPPDQGQRSIILCMASG